MSDEMDLAVLGHRIRHYRRQGGHTLADIGEQVDKPVPYLSQLENGRVEPKIGLLNALADALDVSVGELVDPAPPNRRAELELNFTTAQDDPRYEAFGLPKLKPTAKMSDDVLEHLAGLRDGTDVDPSTAGDALGVLRRFVEYHLEKRFTTMAVPT